MANTITGKIEKEQYSNPGWYVVVCGANFGPYATRQRAMHDLEEIADYRGQDLEIRVGPKIVRVTC